jgi:pimeloyl-ACP methyl ester carboxylesterase
VPTEFAEADGIRFAYRRFGAPDSRPVIFFQCFRGNMDTYDPAITDALAADREVILFDNAGVGSSDGPPAETVVQLAATRRRSSTRLAWPKPTFSGIPWEARSRRW